MGNGIPRSQKSSRLVVFSRLTRFPYGDLCCNAPHAFMSAEAPTARKKDEYDHSCEMLARWSRGIDPSS